MVIHNTIHSKRSRVLEKVEEDDFFEVFDFYFEVTCLQKKKVELSLGNRSSKSEVWERDLGQKYPFGSK